MGKKIESFIYAGTINVPSSKSYLQRAIAITALADGASKIIGSPLSDDVKVAIEIVRVFGASVEVGEDQLSVSPIGQVSADSVDLYCGEAGLSSRMFSPIAAVLFNEVTVRGSGSILTRPMGMVIDALEQLGAKVTSNDGCLPIHISGGIVPGVLHIDGAESSQLLTGLLIALPLLPGDSEIHVSNLSSRPYIQMTLNVLDYFGIEIQHDGFEIFHIRGNQTPSAGTYTVEGDWSGASFHAVGAAISGAVNLMGVTVDSAQADVRILEAVRRAGAKVEKIQGGVKVSKNQLRAFEFDASDCPDLFPPLAALACCCEGSSKLIGTERLVYKESNRAESIQSELKKLGIQVVLEANTMEIKGGNIFGGEVSSNDDHRIAMMAAILASVSDKPISIQKPMAVNKSYPSFYDDLEQIAP